MWLVWLSGFLLLCRGFSCFVVWSVLFSTSLFLPYSPSVPSTFFYPSLKLPYPPQSSGAGISESDEK